MLSKLERAKQLLVMFCLILALYSVVATAAVFYKVNEILSIYGI